MNKIEFDSNKNKMYVPLAIQKSDGKISNYAFLFDTGATNTIISIKLFNYLGYKINIEKGFYKIINNNINKEIFKVKYNGDAKIIGETANGDTTPALTLVLPYIMFSNIVFKNFPIYSHLVNNENQKCLLGIDITKYFNYSVNNTEEYMEFHRRRDYKDVLFKDKNKKNELYQKINIESIIK